MMATRKKKKEERDFSDLDLEIMKNERNGRYFGFLRINGISLTHGAADEIDVFDHLIDIYITHKNDKKNEI